MIPTLVIEDLNHLAPDVRTKIQVWARVLAASDRTVRVIVLMSESSTAVGLKNGKMTCQFSIPQNQDEFI